MTKYYDKKILDLINNTSEQLDGIIKGVKDGHYQVDISKQVLAVRALLDEGNLELLRLHVK